MVAAKKKDLFFTYLQHISSNVKASVNYFADFKLESVSDLTIFSETMKGFEKKGDTLVHELIIALNKVFITPIEREDILSLALRLDDIVDGLYHSAALFDMYSILEFDDFMLEFVHTIKNSVLEIDLAIQQLSNKKLINMREHAIKIKEYESSCDNILRAAIKKLFTVEKDVIRIMQYKEIYEELEEIADACKAAADMFETIIMKNV
jgi:uncharacterized protein